MLRSLVLAALACSAAAFLPPTTSTERMGRRQAMSTGAAALAAMAGAGAANAGMAEPRKADQNAIGVSRVPNVDLLRTHET